MRWVAGDRAITGCAASASQMGRFETKWLGRPRTSPLSPICPGRWIEKVHSQDRRARQGFEWEPDLWRAGNSA
jgi:hypothetical protein